MPVSIKPIAGFLGHPTVLDRVPKEMLPLAEKRLPWTGYLAFCGTELIGVCAFKDEPTNDGVVEIAYFTFPEFEKRGYATEMARCLVKIATESEEATRVLAHTLKEESASTRICRRLGLEFKGEVNDPEDRWVWRWAIDM
jgi:RimJ/RimL family protein N-acetyltransferase